MPPFDQASVFDAEMLIKSFDMYRMTMRNAVRAFWSGAWNWYEFWEGMSIAIRNQFPAAWNEGMRLAGMEPEAITAEEQERLSQEIIKEQGYIARFADAVEAGSKANKGKLEPLMKRAELWAGAYTRIMNLAMTFAKNDPKLRWTLNPAEHCKSCLRLNGKVKRSSFWREKGVYPKAWDKLICKGGCRCELQPTNEPLTRGPLPSLP